MRTRARDLDGKKQEDEERAREQKKKGAIRIRISHVRCAVLNLDQAWAWARCFGRCKLGGYKSFDRARSHIRSARDAWRAHGF